MVQNGTVTHVILDCIYGLNHSEKDGMILKWYFNGKTIFQWIPPSKPKVPNIVQKYKCKVKVGHTGAKSHFLLSINWIEFDISRNVIFVKKYDFC